MGWVKNKMMEMQDNGDWPSHDLAGKYVCTCHFEDKYLNKIGFVSPARRYEL